jgi:hypothetical protein
MLTLIAVVTLAGQPHPTSELLGRWRGESICVKADWNQACHDEIAFYDVVPGARPGHVLLHGYKVVNGENQLMGDLDFAYDAGLHAWAAEFRNARVHIRWTFEVRGTTLEGRVVDLPSQRVARNVRVSREQPSSRVARNVRVSREQPSSR